MRDWDDFEQFRIRQLEDLYARESIETDFGLFLVFEPFDDASMLWIGDLTKAPFEDIVDFARAQGQRHNVKIGFYVTPGWQGDVDAFKAYLEQENIAPAYQMHYWVNDLNDEPTLPEQRASVEVAQDADALGHIVGTAFSQGLGEMAKIQCRRTDYRLNHRFFIAYDDDKPAGCGALSWNDTIGYLHTLGVLPEFRGKGIGTDIVTHRLETLKKMGIPYAVTAVSPKNAPSLAIQRKMGYRLLGTAEAWIEKQEIQTA